MKGTWGHGLAKDTRREGAALWALLNSLSLQLLPLVWLFPCQEVEGESPPMSPSMGRAGDPSPSPAAPLT